jgi:hypothetical protein
MPESAQRYHSFRYRISFGGGGYPIGNEPDLSLVLDCVALVERRVSLDVEGHVDRAAVHARFSKSRGRSPHRKRAQIGWFGQMTNKSGFQMFVTNVRREECESGEYQERERSLVFELVKISALPEPARGEGPSRCIWAAVPLR